MRILVPLDGSTFAETALPTAQRLAAIPGAELHLLAVVKPQRPEAGFATVPIYGGGPATCDWAASSVDRAGAATGEIAFVVEH